MDSSRWFSVVVYRYYYVLYFFWLIRVFGDWVFLGRRLFFVGKSDFFFFVYMCDFACVYSSQKLVRVRFFKSQVLGYGWGFMLIIYYLGLDLEIEFFMFFVFFYGSYEIKLVVVFVDGFLLLGCFRVNIKIRVFGVKQVLELFSVFNQLINFWL